MGAWPQPSHLHRFYSQLLLPGGGQVRQGHTVYNLWICLWLFLLQCIYIYALVVSISEDAGSSGQLQGAFIYSMYILYCPASKPEANHEERMEHMYLQAGQMEQ
jgi:hypothetical protein